MFLGPVGAPASAGSFRLKSVHQPITCKLRGDELGPEARRFMSSHLDGPAADNSLWRAGAQASIGAGGALSVSGEIVG